MSRDFSNSQQATPQDVGATGLSNQIYTLVAADSPLVLTRPADADMLVLVAEAGDWRYRQASAVDDDTLDSAIPSATVSNGSSSMPLFEKRDVVIIAPKYVLVSGPSSGVLTYMWQ